MNATRPKFWGPGAAREARCPVVELPSPSAANSSRTRSSLARGIEITAACRPPHAVYFDSRLSTCTSPNPLKPKPRPGRQGPRRWRCCLRPGGFRVARDVPMPGRKRARLTGIPVSNIVIVAHGPSHTVRLFDMCGAHYFPPPPVANFGIDPQEKIFYPIFSPSGFVKVITQAKGKTPPAEVAAGKRHAGKPCVQPPLLDAERQGGAFQSGQFNPNTVRAAGPTDTDAGMLLRGRKNKKAPSAGATVFACRGYGGRGPLYSADYPYFLQETCAQRFGTVKFPPPLRGHLLRPQPITSTRINPSKFSSGATTRPPCGKTVAESSARLRNLQPSLASAARR